ncbi:MAG: STAS domain-containing protein [Clostridia bacterium]|nr:STAS domain-containing protein [Clostridia bacterium]
MVLKRIWQQCRENFFSQKTAAGLAKDWIGGIIVALVSIPISMGYAQIAGLPMQYGLYGSVMPILFFGLLTSTRDFVFGVDAAPAALTGAAIASMGVTAESRQAIQLVPIIAFLTACWLLLFYFIKAGRAVQYISEPVMGGFVSGICCSIILIQVPKLYGGTAGAGEGPELIQHIAEQFSVFHPLSFGMGLFTIIIIMLCKRIIPKVPMSVVMMLAGALATAALGIQDYGVKLLPQAESGFPGFRMLSGVPDIGELAELMFSSLSIAVVIMAESLLASKANALKDGYRLNNNREILAYAVSNFASSLTGCCPVNGSVSRTGIVRQFGAKSQWLSVAAAAAMLAVLYFGTFLIGYMPVPVLTAIVISALMNACEFDIAVRLWKTSRNEFYIFAAAFFGVLLLGTVYGVMIGVILSFVAVIIQVVVPPRGLMGVIAGKSGFFALERNSQAKPVKDTVIYRFGGSLFFGNIDTFQNDIENAIRDTTKYVVVNAGAVSSIDITAADRLLLMYRQLQERGIQFYITEHVGEVNDQLREYGEAELIHSGAVRMTMALALRDAGLHLPYPTETEEEQKASDRFSYQHQKSASSDEAYYGRNILKNTKGIQAELEWAFGKEAELVKEMLAQEIFEKMKDDATLTEEHLEAAEMRNRWGRFNLFDEEELLDRLEMLLMADASGNKEKLRHIENVIRQRRESIEKKMYEMDHNVFERLKQHRGDIEKEWQRTDPQSYERLLKRRWRHIEQLREQDPELAQKYDEAYRDNDKK